MFKTFTEELMPIILKLFKNITEQGTLPNSFYEATITLMPKSDSSVQSLNRVRLFVTP